MTVNNNGVFFFLSDLKTIILNHDALHKRGKNILRHYLFRDIIIQNCHKIYPTN